jgi:hypothetical protein
MGRLRPLYHLEVKRYMDTNIPIEQAIVQKDNLSLGKISSKSSLQKSSFKGEETYESNSFEFENGPMMTTSEILDFSSGIDSTEYDQPER